MAQSKNNIEKLLRKYGYGFPQSEDEVNAFENKFGKSYIHPNKWPDIFDIINEPDSKEAKSVIKLNNPENQVINSLAMAARDGKSISKKDRDQMDKDKKDARKK